jgi:hypothetical protein
MYKVYVKLKRRTVVVITNAVRTWKQLTYLTQVKAVLRFAGYGRTTLERR